MTTSCYLHPGALLDELLDDYAMSLSECAARSGLSADVLQVLRNGQCDIDADMDRRLAQCFAHSAGLWLDWQAFYEAGATTALSSAARQDHARPETLPPGTPDIAVPTG